MSSPKQRYQEKLKDPRWQKKRLKILERDEWGCCNCGSTERSLQVHHKRYFGDPWDCPDEHLETLCEVCHKFLSGKGDVLDFVIYMGAENACALVAVFSPVEMLLGYRQRAECLWPEGGQPDVIARAVNADCESEKQAVIDHVKGAGVSDMAICAAENLFTQRPDMDDPMRAYVFVDSLVMLKGGKGYGEYKCQE